MSDTALGAALTIDSSVLDKIAEAETKIKRLEETTRTSAGKINKSFRSMGDVGVQYFIDKLKLAQGELSKINGSGVNIGIQNLNKVGEQANNAATNITRAAVAMNHFGESGKNIAQLTDNIKNLNDKLTKGDGLPTANLQQYFVDKKKAYEDELKFQKKSTDEKLLSLSKERESISKNVIEQQVSSAKLSNQRIKDAERVAKAEEAADRGRQGKLKMYAQMFERIAKEEERSFQKSLAKYRKMIKDEQAEDTQKYHAWLALKDAELKRHIQVENEKRERTRAIINEQLKFFEELENKKAQLMSQNQTAKNSGNKINTLRREQEKMYTQMFDKIDAKQKAQAEAAKKAAEAEALANKRKAEQVISDYQRQMKAAQDYRKKQESMYAKLFEQSMSKPKNALHFAENASSISQRTKAIKYLTEARAQLSTTDKNYESTLKRINDAIRRMNAENEKAVRGVKNLQQKQKNLMNTSDQLARKLALIFSVSQIQGYVKNLIKVRGEFELQNTALASILQNKDKADKLFGQITELAVKSPFTLKELTTYTKSLAAYQVKYEELYDTTKMLADVSSGLGVDMQRLILAFGQVKAANFLRGTEVRQFTEAGFNILGELAKYYSELEGRMVSVGEVQGMVTKRMVAFGDVEEVFKRVTSAGGMFYQMQERQAATLAGQVSNLRDSIDLMLNDIGKANDGTLKDAVAGFREIIENWREVVFVMQLAIYMLGAWKTYSIAASVGNKNFAITLASLISKISPSSKMLNSFANSLSAAAVAARGLTAILGAAVPILLIAGISELIRVSTKAYREAERLKESLRGIASEGFIRSAELARTFETLANKAVSAADGSKEQKNALEELSRTYADILPHEQLEIENLRALKGEYESVTTAIYTKIEASIKEKQIQEVGNLYGKEYSNALDDLVNKISKYNISLEKSRAIVAEFRKAQMNGLIDTDATAKKFLEDLIEKSTEAKVLLTEKGFKDMDGGITWGDIVIKEIGNVLNAYTKFHVAVENINKRPTEYFNVKATPLYGKLKKELDSLEKLKEEWDNSNKSKFEFKVEFNEASKNQMISQYQKFIDDITKKKESGIINPKDFVSADLVIEEAERRIKKLDISEQIAQVEDLRVKFSKLYNVDFEKFNFTKMLEGQGFNEFIDRLNSGIKSYQEIIDVFDEAAKKGKEVPQMQKWHLLQGKSLEEIKQSKEALVAFKDAIAFDIPKNKNTKNDDENKIFKDRIEFFKRVNSEYKKLLKNYNEEAARLKVINSMKAEAEQLGVSNIFTIAKFDERGTLESLNKLKASLPKELASYFEKVFGGIELDIDVKLRQDKVKTIQDAFDSMFGDYELSVELEKLGLDKNLTSQLFGIDTFSLDELRKRLEPLKKELQDTLGEQGLEAWRNMDKKISDMENKELQERLKTYSKYLKKSVSERVAIEMEAQKEIEEVRNTKEFTPELKQNITDKINKEKKIALDKNSWKEFQKSDMYLQLFEDLEYVSTKAINSMLEKLSSLRESLKDLPPEDLKEINNQMRKLEEIKIKRNPFKELFSKDVKKSSMSWIELGNTLNDVSSTAESVASSFENIFGTMDAKTADVISPFSEIASGFGNAASGVGRIMAGDWIGGSLQALSGVASTIGSIFAIGDKKKEREIKRQLELVEQLEKSYEKLEKAIDDAYSLDTYKASNEKAIENLKAQNEALQKSIAAEEDKKKTDHDRVNDWKNQIEDNLDRIKELQEKFYSDLGGFGSESNIKSAAQEFADAWLEAYIETGDGLDALSNKWDEYVKNVVSKQLMMKGTEKFLKPTMDMLDSMLEDSTFTPEESRKLKEQIDKVMPQLNEFWEGIAQGFDLGKDSKDSMTGLQKGIQGVTEETAEVLASITESIRFFSADSNTQLKNILAVLTNPTAENPYLSELRIQTEQLRAINGLWGSITKNSTGKGKVLKVEIV